MDTLCHDLTYSSSSFTTCFVRIEATFTTAESATMNMSHRSHNYDLAPQTLKTGRNRASFRAEIEFGTLAKPDWGDRHERGDSNGEILLDLA